MHTHSDPGLSCGHSSIAVTAAARLRPSRPLLGGRFASAPPRGPTGRRPVPPHPNRKGTLECSLILPSDAPRISVVYRRANELKPDPTNARRHSRKQIRQIARSIEAFGFNVPILVDAGAQGHPPVTGRLLASGELGRSEVPAIFSGVTGNFPAITANFGSEQGMSIGRAEFEHGQHGNGGTCPVQRRSVSEAKLPCRRPPPGGFGAALGT
jgi:ParB-like nuclease domain